MRKSIALLLCITIYCATQSAFAQGNEFKVRYSGGTLKTTTKPDDWGNKLTITSDQILLDLKDGQKLVIDPKKVNGLSYGKEATRRTKTYIGLAFISPIFLFGLLKKNKKHFVGIEYTDNEGKNVALLLQAKNDQYRAVLTALKGITGKEVATEEKEKK
ncbi:MAG: hypothetical protein ICV60_13185 [Pyrinomonadaceae bacterium]|nr:hypothetical protein [Pyrinomonadaceae bacterium]